PLTGVSIFGFQTRTQRRKKKRGTPPSIERRRVPPPPGSYGGARPGSRNGLEVLLETVEDAGPAFEMAVATFDAGKFFVRKNEPGIVAARQEFDGDECFVGFAFAELGFAVVFLPGPAKNEASVRLVYA